MARMAGRSPNSANPVVRTEVEIPSNNTETIPPEKPGFWELVCSLSPEQWWSGTQGEKGYKVYLYRDNPRGPGQGSGYIRLINHFFDVEFVKQEFGGYDYHALLNDPSGAMVARANFSISAPPKGIVDASSPQNGSQPAAAPGDSSFQAQVLREMRESNERTHRLMERIMTDRSSPVAGDPLGIVAPVVQGIVTMFSNAMPKAADPLETFARIQQLMPKPPDMFEVLLKAKEVGLLGAAGMGGGNLMDQLGVLKTLAGELGWVAGGNGTRARPWYEFLMEKIVEKGPDILSGIGTIVDKYNAVEQTRLRTITAAANLQRPPAPPAQIPPAAPGAPAPAAAAPAPQQPANFPNVPNLELEPIGAPIGSSSRLGTLGKFAGCCGAGAAAAGAGAPGAAGGIWAGGAGGRCKFAAAVMVRSLVCSTALYLSTIVPIPLRMSGPFSTIFSIKNSYQGRARVPFPPATHPNSPAKVFRTPN